MLNGVDLEVRFWVFDLKMSLLNEVRNFFKLIIGIIGMVEHDAIEDLSQMGVKVKLNSASLVTGLLKLSLNALKSFQAYAHLYIYLF